MVEQVEQVAKVQLPAWVPVLELVAQVAVAAVAAAVVADTAAVADLDLALVLTAVAAAVAAPGHPARSTAFRQIAAHRMPLAETAQ